MTVLAPPPPRRATWLHLLGAFVRRDAAMTWSYRLPFAMGLLQSLLSLLMLYFLGRLVGRHVGTEGLVGGYFAFAVVGTTMLAVFTATMLAVSQRLRTDQTTGTLEVLFTMPPSPIVSILGGALFPVVYAMAGSLITLLVAFTLGMQAKVTVASAFAGLATLVGALVFYGAVGVAFGAFVLVFKRGDTLTALATGALTLLGGVYYPLSVMPRALRALADVLPFTWAVSALRSTLLGGTVPAGRLGLLWLSALVTVPLSLWIFGLALKNVRTKGTLGQY